MPFIILCLPKYFIGFSYLYQFMHFVNVRFKFTHVSVGDFLNISKQFFKIFVVHFIITKNRKYEV